MLQINVEIIKLSYIARNKLVIQACQELATLYLTGMSVQYCTMDSVHLCQCFVYKSASNPSSFILLDNLFTPL